jgi:glycerol-3-phosphate dehydrogenase (NAD(P)+)
MDLDRAHRLAREKGASALACWVARLVLTPVFLLYFRLQRIGARHVLREGPLLLAPNHRSFSDPFFIGICIRRRLRFVAKMELFDKHWKARLMVALGAFPIRRGEADEQAMETARIILEQGGALVMFPEGTRVRPGPLAEPRSGIGRLALETGAPIVPVALKGTEDIRSGWRIRPRKVRVRFGRELTFPRPVDGAVTAGLAREVTARIWPCVQLQWEWLGGVPPIRSAAVVGAGSFGTALAAVLSRAGTSVQLGCRTPEQAEALAEHAVNERYLPGTVLPDAVVARAVEDLDLEAVDLVCLAVPSRALPEAMARIAGRLPEHAGLLITSKGLVGPTGALPGEWAAERAGERPLAYLGGPGHAGELAVGEAGLVVASEDRTFVARVARLFDAAGLECDTSGDALGLQLAGCAKNAAALAAGAALSSGANGAGRAAGRVWSECHALARAQGAREESFAGLAGTGDLVATVIASASRNRRAGELLAQGATPEMIEDSIGQAAEALDSVPLLSRRMRRAGIKAPATAELGALIARGRGDFRVVASRDARASEASGKQRAGISSPVPAA